MGQKILVTGGAGYLGSTMVLELLEKGHEVTVLDNFLYSQNSLAHICHFPNFHIVCGDIRLKDKILPLMAKADIIIPLAAFVGAPLCSRDPVGATTTNYDAALMMLENLGKAQSVIMPTTNSAYGTNVGNNPCTEESKLNPLTQYAKEKVKIEQELMKHENGTSFRLATVFGMSPRMRIDLLVNDFTYRAVNDGSIILFESHFKRNYIHVRDVARVFLHAIENFNEMKGGVYNVGLSTANLSKKELCQTIQKHLPNFVFREAPTGKDPDQRNYIVSNKKIEETGFKPTYSLDDGIKELIKGYNMIRNNRYGNI